MNALNESALEFLSRLGEKRRTEEFVADFRQLAEAFGVTRYYLGDMVGLSTPSVRPMLQNLPDGWLEYYRDGDFAAHDPVVLSPRHSGLVVWSDARRRFGNSRKARQIEADTVAAGMRDGLSFPMPSNGPEGFVASVALDDAEALTDQQKWLLYKCMLAFQHKLAFAAVKARPSVHLPLTVKEREVLDLLAGRAKGDR